MLDNLRDLVQHIQHAADGIAESSRDLSRATREASATGQEMAGTMDVVSTGAVRQQEDVHRASARIRDLAHAIRASADAAHGASRLAAEARERATSGADISRVTIAKMQDLFEQVEQAGQAVIRFDQKIRSAHRITEMITSVAEKTHLLSLNASIEAARAGDAGRGFTVVAEEIRKLAESAGTSAEQIEALIRQVEEESFRISEVMRTIGEGVRQGREDFSGISGSLGQIESGVRDAAHRSETIFETAGTQVGEAEELVREIDRIAAVAAENAKATTGDMRRGLDGQTEALEQMVRHAAQLQEMSVRLEEVARRFRAR
jgi:methyl-accepting chemotaxis protein